MSAVMSRNYEDTAYICNYRISCIRVHERLDTREDEEQERDALRAEKREMLRDMHARRCTCVEEIVHALAILHMQVQRCTCTHLGVHHHTNASARMHPPAGRHAMQVGVEWNAGRNAGLLPAGRTVHYRVTNSSLQRVGLAISRLLHPFFLHSRGFLHVLSV